jgi:hypothetical protein
VFECISFRQPLPTKTLRPQGEVFSILQFSTLQYVVGRHWFNAVFLLPTLIIPDLYISNYYVKSSISTFIFRKFTLSTINLAEKNKAVFYFLQNGNCLIYDSNVWLCKLKNV